MTRILRRFNYTKRIKIARRQVLIDVEATSDGACLATVRRLDLSERGQHSEAIWNSAEVFLEARRPATQSWARHGLGTVFSLENGHLPKSVCLENFDDDLDITFRVKVVDQQSRLLADGDHVVAGLPQESDREPLIVLYPSDLGEELWRVKMYDVDGPRVLVNRRLPNSSGVLLRDPLVRGLVLPQIVRNVLFFVANAEQKTDVWVIKWSEFVKRLTGEDVPDFDNDNSETLDSWIDEVVIKFTDELKFVTAAEELLHKVGEE